MRHRVIAINLPQFHPFKENDDFWGKGFTEWTNVTKAKPRFKGHYQPHLPTETGFYDLRLPEVRNMQADMAREAGIYGFCYYHYWFNGRMIMDRPVNEILKSKEPDFPFMLCWANENWDRTWDGNAENILLKQVYSVEDDIEHIRWLCRNVFPDKRYIRVNGKPVFILYRKSLFPDFPKTIRVWRKVAKEEFGMELYLMYADFPFDEYGEDPQLFGTDACFDFQPLAVRRYLKSSNDKIKRWSWLIPYLRSRYWYRQYFDTKPDIFSYGEYVEFMKNRPIKNVKRYPCVSPGFDNSPRRVDKTFLCFKDSSPKIYGEWLKDSLLRYDSFGDEENFVFINAWNEWAEGNHLEPDIKWGKAYIEKTKSIINEFNY